VADRDGDGVSDGDDACPDVVGDATPTAKRRGCPPDRDGDGVPDRFDRCPDRRGVDAVDPDKRGCPADGDGDGIPDEEDACPADKGIATGDRATHGCPKSVRFEGKQIVILEQIHFATGRDVIEADSSGVLDQVAQVMRDHPDLARVAVEGHTDDEGAEQANLALSQRRAVAVVRALVSRGIDARRLEARGYGPRRAITDNKTPEGRAKNRRVEFLVVLRTDRGEAGWRDGPVDDAPRGAP
jgi:outer membrane protein OmpA-like peptidoglycan-associated protein